MGDDFRIKANRKSIKELLSILLDNAIKFSDSGDRIELRYFLEGNQVHIEVEDEGIGIADEDQDRIFDRFYKVSSSRTHGEDDGFGLGLSIAREIVRNHKGSIRVKSQLGDGSVFYIKLPQEN
jgi:signal transduction histidine kinase